MHRTLALAAALLLLGLGPIARAQYAAWDPPTRTGFTEPPRSGGQVELGFWTASRETTFVDSSISAVNGLLRAAIVFDELIDIGLVAGWAWGRIDVDTFFGRVTEEAASAADPMLYAGVVLDEQAWRLRLGGGLTAPAAPGSDEARFAAYYGAATHGLGELWLWAPNRLSVVPYAIIEAVPVEYLYLEGTLSPAVLIPIADDTPAVLTDDVGEADFIVDASIAAGFRHDFFLAGLRLRGVFLPTIRSDADQAQTSMEIFARGTFDVAEMQGLMVFAEWRLHMNLDDDLGFAFDQLECGAVCSGVWGMYLAFGVGRPVS